MLRTLAFTLLGLSFAGAAQAQLSSNAAASPTTRQVPFAGVALDASGAPIRGTATVTFELFEDQDGGSPLWRETQRVQTDGQGRYLAYLGTVSPLPQAAFTEERARWVGVTIQRRAQPRAMLVAVPYALRAADADTLGGKPASDFVRARADGRLETSAGLVAEAAVDGTGVAGQIAKFVGSTTLSSSVITETGTNRIGFGLTDPTGAGVVDSVFTIKNFDNNTGFGILNESQQRRFAINTLASGGWLLYDGGSSTWNAGLAQKDGKLGIGTSAPENELHIGSGTNNPILKVDGAVNTALGARIRLTEVFSSDYGAELMMNGASDKFVLRGIQNNLADVDNILTADVYATGNVGIGILSAADKLHVAGDIRVGTGTTGCVKDADATVIAGTCSSDRRFKRNITPFARSIDKLSLLQPVHFFWRADEFPDRHFGATESFGLVAQDVEQVLPELVATDDKGFKAVNYSALPLHMLQAIKDLKAENDALKQQMKAQEDRLQKLEAAIIK